MTGTRGREIALLAVTGLVGVGLAVHGWSVRASGLPAPMAGALPSASGSPGATSSPSQAPSSPQIGPTASPSSPAPSSGSSAGPLLSSQSFAQYAFQVWPGPLSGSAKAALTGLSISVHHQANGIRVAAGVIGQSRPSAQFYPNGAKVYVIEASLGDESGNTDYNLGDDGLIVTDASGRILR